MEPRRVCGKADSSRHRFRGDVLYSVVEFPEGYRLVAMNQRGEVTHITDTEGATQIVRGNYDAVGDLVGNTVVVAADSIPRGRVERTDESGEFAYGGELRLEAMFEITKGFGVRLGSEMIMFADGIGRGRTKVDDHFRLMGFSLGFAFNR